MKTLKTLAAAAVAIAALAGAADAGAKKHGFKHGFHYKPAWAGTYHHGGKCWYEVHTVPQTYYAKVKLYRHGKPYWKQVKQIRYVEQPQKVCDWYRY